MASTVIVTHTFIGWNAGDFGWGADRTENILWRLENGELDDVNPKVIVILAGTTTWTRSPGTTPRWPRSPGPEGDRRHLSAEGARGDDHLTAIFLCDGPGVMPTITRINANMAKMADGKQIRFLDVNAKLADANGTLFQGMMVDGLHPSLKGYEVWADGLKPILTELLGPPAAIDKAPPPTGDSSASQRTGADGTTDVSPCSAPSWTASVFIDWTCLRFPVRSRPKRARPWPSPSGSSGTRGALKLRATRSLGRRRLKPRWALVCAPLP